ncbi:MAG: response regulator transcription factor [Tenacibaculum sp.]|nr:response regulator transcription factor [Tenacibaculum sp.]
MLNNHGKSTVFKPCEQIVAGILQSDSNIEFVGVKKNKIKRVIWVKNGSSHYFTDLPSKYFELLKEAYLQDDNAMAFLKNITSDFYRQVELYTYYVYGDLDTTPDIINGRLNNPENFRDKQNCPSLAWNKEITINGNALTPREIVISDMFGKDMPDKAIASTLGICISHFDVIKRRLYKKAGVNTKTAYIMKALNQNVIRYEYANIN